MSVFDRFEEVRLYRHQYAREWKAKTGQPVFGYLCTYAPEEIIYAAGILPVRILGSHEPTDITEAHITSQWCPLCRDALAQGLLGHYDYLEGIVHAFSCAHMFNTMMSWQRHIPISYYYDMYVPEHLFNPHAARCLTQEIAAFRSSLSRWLGRFISDQDLDRAIEVYNTSSRLMKEIYQARKDPHPHLSGAEAVSMVLASAMMDKAEHNRLLLQAIDEVSRRPGIPNPGIRLMLLGSENDDVDFIRFIESLGATVVIEEQCTGSRYFWQSIEPGADRVAAIAQRYLHRPACAHKDVVERHRFSHILNLAQEYQVQGVILILQKFCDIYEFEIPPLMNLLKENNLPMLVLEVDITVPVGQFRTRIEAFLETLALELV